jgi:hypothetical protein
VSWSKKSEPGAGNLPNEPVIVAKQTPVVAFPP